MDDLNEVQSELKDIEERNGYLKYELYNAIEDGDIFKIRRVYNLLNEGQVLEIELNSILESHAILN